MYELPWNLDDRVYAIEVCFHNRVDTGGCSCLECPCESSTDCLMNCCCEQCV